MDNNCVVVCASGNDGSSHLLFPASMPEVLSVGAATSSGRRWASQYGSTLDVVAPGNEVWTTTLGGTYISEPGTSMAAPHAAGIAALILSAKPGLSAKQVMDAIEQGAVELSTHPATQTKVNGPWNNEVGYGLVDAFAAVNTAMTFTPSIPPVAPPSTPSIYCDAYPVTDWNFVQDYGGSDMVFHTYPNRVVTFNIGSNYDSGTTFEWRTGGYLTPTSGTGNQFRVSSRLLSHHV